MAIELHNKYKRRSATWALWAEECCYMMETRYERKMPIISQPTCFVNVVVMKITHAHTKNTTILRPLYRLTCVTSTVS